MSDKKEILRKLENCIGSTIFTKHPTMDNAIYSEGIKCLVTECKANWMLLDLNMIISFNDDLNSQEFLTIDFKVNDNKGVWTFGDGNDNILFTSDEIFTNFPLNNIIIWFQNNVFYLPQEH